MKNITVKQESLSNWREEFDIDEAKVEAGRSDYGKASVRNKRKFGKEGEPAVFDASGERGKMIDQRREEHKKRRGVKKEHVEGGIQVQNVADGLNFTEVETVDIIKPEPIKGASNWKLEMVTEMLIAEGYNDEEIVTILTEELPKIPLGPIVTGAFRGAWNLSTKGVRNAYNLGKGLRGIVNRGARDTKLTKDVFDTAKKLRNPDGVSITKSPRINTPSKGGGLVKSFKGFMQNVRDAGSNLVNRTKGKLDRINAKKAEIQTTAKDVDVLGGAATNPTTAVKPMKNITPTPIGDGIAKVANQVKTGATAAVAGSGVVAGSKLTSNSPSKVATGTELKGDKPLSTSIRGDQKKNTPSVEKKVEAPITNDGKKEVNPSKNEKITTSQKKSGGRPFDADRGKTVDRVYGAQIAQTRKLKGDAAADKQRKKFMSRPVTSLEMDEGMDNMGGPAALGAVLTTTVGLGKAAYDGIKNLKNTLQDKQNEKKKKIKNLTQSYSWRDELNLQEMGAYRGGGTIIDPSGSRNKFGYPDSLKPGSGPTKEVPLTPSQNRMLVKKKTKTTKVG